MNFTILNDTTMNADKIDNYLKKKMTREEEMAFLKEIENDRELHREILWRKDINSTLNDDAFIQLRSNIQKKNAEIKKFPQFFQFYQNPGKKLFLAAATVAVFIVSGVLYMVINSRTLSSDQIAAKYYKPAIAIENTRSIEQNEKLNTAKAFQLYNSSKFEEALPFFLSFENPIVSSFYSGICYYELQDYHNARERFKFIVADRDNLLFEQAQWYLTLSLFQLDEKAEAKEVLTSIASSSSPYAKQSREILKMLGK
jgi:hypothetical protein